MPGTGNVTGSDECSGRDKRAGRTTPASIEQSLNKLQATLAIVVVNDKKEGTEIALMVVLDVGKDASKMLIVEVGIERRCSLDEVVRARPLR